MNTELSHRSRQFLAQSANSYEEVTFSSGRYIPTLPFKGLFCTGAGDVEIMGVDGVSVILTLGADSMWPLGGIQVVEAGTTATLVAIF